MKNLHYKPKTQTKVPCMKKYYDFECKHSYPVCGKKINGRDFISDIFVTVITFWLIFVTFSMRKKMLSLKR